jgi:hypothetical protein
MSDKVKRTPEEILAKIREHEKNKTDFFGFQRQDLITFLPWEEAKEFLKKEYVTKVEAGKEEKWEAYTDPVERIKDYMDFALDKATGHRGLSAGRSIDHMQAWLWLAGEDELLAQAEDDKNWGQYGAGILMLICKHYDIDYKSLLYETYIQDFENMAKGEPCRPGCNEGCSV